MSKKLPWIGAGLGLLAAGAFLAFRPSQAPDGKEAAPSLKDVATPELLRRLSESLPEEEYEALLGILVARGRPAADALLAASRGNKDKDWDPVLPALARIRRDSPDPALREEVDAYLRDVFPMKIVIARSVSDEQAQREAAMARARPGETVEYWYNPMGSKSVGEEEVEVHSIAGLIDLLDEENAAALDTLTYRFAGEFHHRFAETLDAELRKAAMQPGTAKGAALSLVRIHRAQAAPFLAEMMKDPREFPRKAAVRAFEALEADAPEALPQILDLLADERCRDSVLSAVRSVSDYLAFKGKECAGMVMGRLAKADGPTRISLMEALRSFHVPEGVPLAPVEALMKDPDKDVAYWAEKTLDTLRPPPPDPEP